MEKPEQTYNESAGLPKRTLELKKILGGARQKLEVRLQKLTNPYHNKRHAEEIKQNMQTFLDNLANPNLFSDEQKLLLIECALRHDDGHSGAPYRQDVVNDGFSNEEYAVHLLKEDLQEDVPEEDIRFMEKTILATSFGQNGKGKFPEGKKHYYRPYKPTTDAERLLALADVIGFVKGWDKWADDSLRLLQESPENTPPNVGTWLANQREFVDMHIITLLDSVRHLLKQEFFDELKRNLRTIKQKISEIEDGSNSDRVKYDKRLEKIRERREKK